LPESNKGFEKNTEASSVDWAEKLKASMKEAAGDLKESPAESVDDDLAALLRAQLGKSCVASTPASSLDTSEFETNSSFPEMDEEIEEDIEEYPDEDPIEDDIEEYPDEDPIEDDIEEYPDEDSIEEDIEEYPDEDSIEEDIEEYPDEDSVEDDIEEYPDEDPIEDDIEEYCDNDFSEESNYEDVDPNFFENASYDAAVEADVTDGLFLEQPIEDSVSDIPIPVSTVRQEAEYRQPTANAMTDDCFNRAPAKTGQGRSKLREIALENQQLLSESRKISDQRDETNESSFANMNSQAHAGDQNRSGGMVRSHERNGSDSPQICDPLQLSLDDISPTVVRSQNTKNEAHVTSLDYLDEETRGTSKYEDTVAEKRADIAELEDTDLYIRLGYEDSLRRVDEQMRMEKLRSDASDVSKPCSSNEQATVRAKSEYSGRRDTDRIERKYVHTHCKNLLRTILATLGALLALAYEILTPIMPLPDTTLLSNSIYYVPVGLLWMILICLPFLSRIGRGLKGLLDFEPTRYTVPALALLTTAAHGILLIAFGRYQGMPLFFGASLLILAVAALSEYFVSEGEHYAFSVASSGKTAYVLTDENTPAASALQQAHPRVGKEHSALRRSRKKQVFTVVRTGRLSDYFARTQRYNPYMGLLNYFIPLALLAAIACAGTEIVLGGDLLTDGLRVFVFVYLLGLPSAYLLAMNLPLFNVNRHLRKKGAAVIGTAAPLTYAGKQDAHLIFSDGDALKALYRKDITLRGDEDSEEYRRMADVVFRFLNTPLATDPLLREASLDNYRIEIAEAIEQYMRLYLVDTERGDATEIMMGSHSALTRRGIRLPKINMEQKYKKSKGSHVLYLAFNRNFRLAYAVEYRVGRTFARTVASLNHMGYRVSISSFDPLVNPDIEGISRLRKKSPLNILRPSVYEPIHKSRSSGLIATGRSLDILYPLNGCRAMLRAYRRSHLFSWLALLATIGIAIATVCFGESRLQISAGVALGQLLQVFAVTWLCKSSTNTKILDRDVQTASSAKELGDDVGATSATEKRTNAD